MISSNKTLTEIPTIYMDNNNCGAPTVDALRTPISFVNATSETPAVKFLGVHFDPELNFKFHLKTINAKMSRPFTHSDKPSTSYTKMHSSHYTQQQSTPT